jgi:hypothetical protein
MSLTLVKPEPTKAQLQARAASGLKGCVQARRDLVKAVCAQLRKEVAGPHA